MNRQDLVDEIMSIVEHGSDADLLDMYNKTNETDLTFEDIDW